MPPHHTYSIVSWNNCETSSKRNDKSRIKCFFVWKKKKKNRSVRYKNIIRGPTVLHERRMQIYPMEADQIESIYTCTLHTSYPTSRTTRILINTFLNIPPLLLIAPVKNFDKVEEHVIYISKKICALFPIPHSRLMMDHDYRLLNANRRRWLGRYSGVWRRWYPDLSKIESTNSIPTRTLAP